MKNLNSIFVLVLFAFLVIACEKEPENFIKVSGEITNLDQEIDSVQIYVPNGYKKQIAIGSDGSFEDTLHITEGKYLFKIGNEYGNIFLKNGDDINLTTDYKDFDQKLAFTGSGESVKKSNVLKAILLLQINNLNSETLGLNDKAFQDQIASYEAAYDELKKENTALPASFWKESDASLQKNIEDFTNERKRRLEVQDRFTGKAAPSFAMESIDGTVVSLKDFRGKYVYIDVWATWCGPCKREIPSLKDLDEKYEGTNLEIVSMSVDEADDKEKWKTFVQENELQGTQIFANDAWKSKFVQELGINSIPRFVLIDPEGIIVSPDAPRPSDSKLEELLNSLPIEG